VCVCVISPSRMNSVICVYVYVCMHYFSFTHELSDLSVSVSFLPHARELADLRVCVCVCVCMCVCVYVCVYMCFSLVCRLVHTHIYIRFFSSLSLRLYRSLLFASCDVYKPRVYVSFDVHRSLLMYTGLFCLPHVMFSSRVCMSLVFVHRVCTSLLFVRRFCTSLSHVSFICHF